MPQLAPVNWLFLFFIFWFITALSTILIWWSSKTEYMIDSTISQKTMTPPSNNIQNPQMKTWNW